MSRETNVKYHRCITKKRINRCKEYSKATLHHSPKDTFDVNTAYNKHSCAKSEMNRNEINITLAVPKRAFIGSTHNFRVTVCIVIRVYDKCHSIKGSNLEHTT